MKYWIIINGESVGPFDISQLKSRQLSADTKVWRQGLPQWTAARCLPELADVILPDAARPVGQPMAVTADYGCPAHLRAAIVTTVIILLSFFDVFSPLSIIANPCFYLLLPLSYLSIRSALTTRRLWRAGEKERAVKRGDRTVLLITLNAVLAIVLFPFYVVSLLFM